MIRQYKITDQWRAITTAGQSGTCWMNELGLGQKGKADVLIYHSSTIVPSGRRYNTIAKRLYRPNSNQSVLLIGADNENDIYYAKCLTAGSEAKINVDVA